VSEKFFTSTAQGIGEGALNNVNMTTDEKAEFINQWENDAKQYDDYETVTTDIKKSLNENPEYKEIAEKVKEIKKTPAARDSKGTSSTKPEEKTTYSENYVAKGYTTSPVKSERKEITKSGVKDVKENDKQELTSLQHTTNPVIIAKTIKSEGISEAIKKYSPKEVISQVLDNQNLKYMRPQLATFIKSYDINTLKNITQDCSDSSFIYICSIINGEYVDELKNNRQHLCFAASKQLENIEGSND